MLFTSKDENDWCVIINLLNELYGIPRSAVPSSYPAESPQIYHFRVAPKILTENNAKSNTILFFLTSWTITIVCEKLRSLRRYWWFICQRSTGQHPANQGSAASIQLEWGPVAPSPSCILASLGKLWNDLCLRSILHHIIRVWAWDQGIGVLFCFLRS